MKNIKTVKSLQLTGQGRTMMSTEEVQFISTLDVVDMHMVLLFECRNNLKDKHKKHSHVHHGDNLTWGTKNLNHMRKRIQSDQSQLLGVILGHWLQLAGTYK